MSDEEVPIGDKAEGTDICMVCRFTPDKCICSGPRTSEQKFPIDIVWGFKKIKRTAWTREVRRDGFFRWFWVLSCNGTQLTNGPFLTKRQAERDMAKYPTL